MVSDSHDPNPSGETKVDAMISIANGDSDSATTAPARGLEESNFGKQDFMSVINQIRSTGAGAEIDLPTIVVAGNQSSGKSSVIEAISGINLPRSVGTCTRVPTEVRLKKDRSKVWTCTIKIRWEERGTGEVLHEKTEESFGEPIHNPDEVGDIIRRSQLAILNPSVSSGRFLTYPFPKQAEKHPLGSVQQLSFSKNVIVLEIMGPDVIDLALVDLPGIIQNVNEDEDESSIGLIQDMVKQYIAKKQSLILLVINMRDDLQNQSALRLAREADPKGKRTIGVLTKADTLSGRERDIWVEVLKNKTHPLTHGYFATRQRNDDELGDGVSFERAREIEASFFASEAPWSHLSPRWEERLGTRNLTAALSDHLLDLIREQLPGLIEDIHKRFDETEVELAHLGAKPSDDPFSEMMGLIDQFTSSLNAKTLGDPGHELLNQQIRDAYHAFQREIRRTAPDFIPFTEREIERQDNFREVAGVDGDASDSSYRESDMDSDEDASEEDTASDSGSASGRMNVDDMKEFIERSVTRELPGTVPYRAKTRLIVRFTASWSKLSQDLLHQVLPLLQNNINNAVMEIFGKYKENLLPTTINEIIKTTVGILLSNAQIQIFKMVELDRRPFSLNFHYLSTSKAKIFAELKAERQPGGAATPRPDSTINEAQQELINGALTALAALGYSGLNIEDLDRLRPPDKYDDELSIMAEVGAYWKVAYKRIIDNVPRIIDAELIIPVAQHIKVSLTQGLSLATDSGRDRCKTFLAESSNSWRRRAELEQRKIRLNNAKEAIRSFGAN